jgi:thiamine transport system permease protein
LESIPEENLRLAAQLGFNSRDHWRHLERPALLSVIPGAGLLIFLLCAASFAIVLTLGGGPAATTLEVAIYQALRSDFDPARATMLALVQTAICAALVLLAQRFPANFATMPSLRAKRSAAPASWIDIATLVLGALLLIPPLVAIVASGLSSISISPQLLRATATSLALGAAAAFVCFAICWPMASKKLSFVAVMAALILPPAVMATGWFILLSRVSDMPGLPAVLVVALNALMALPFAHTILAPAIAQHAAAHDRLCAGLGIGGFTRFRLIDAPALKRPIALALAMAAVVSLGDLTAISLFGNGGLLTLPALVYRDMGQYRIDSAAFTALVLAALAVALLALSDRFARAHD